METSLSYMYLFRSIVKFGEFLQFLRIHVVKITYFIATLYIYMQKEEEFINEPNYSNIRHVEIIIKRGHYYELSAATEQVIPKQTLSPFYRKFTKF